MPGCHATATSSEPIFFSSLTLHNVTVKHATLFIIPYSAAYIEVVHKGNEPLDHSFLQGPALYGGSVGHQAAFVVNLG